MKTGLSRNRKAGFGIIAGLMAVLIFSGSCSPDRTVIVLPEFNIAITLLHSELPVPGNLTIRGRNSYGDLVWMDERKLEAGENLMRLRSMLHQYSFTINAAGVKKELTISETDLLANPRLVIGLSELDYYRYATTDGNVTVLFPRDPTNPYCEIQVVDKSKIIYGYLSRSFWRDGKPVHDELYRSLEFAGVDNVTFKPYARFSGQYGKTWDAAYGSIYYLSTDNVFDEILHDWP